ncbi:hypothetical protein [Fulvivirga sediminis]|nr:hypothetical protein [Fulvivirga sediminis]
MNKRTNIFEKIKMIIKHPYFIPVVVFILGVITITVEILLLIA